MAQLALDGGTPVLRPEHHRLWPRLGAGERAAVLRVLDRGILSGGDAPEARAFEREFASQVGAEFALLTHSGTSALEMAVGALELAPGDEVIVPALSWISTALCVLLRGGVPRFVDVEADTGNLDPTGLAEALNPRTRAVMPVHLNGLPVDLDSIQEFCAAHDLALVEDAAQAHLAMHRGRPVGALGFAGGFSLQNSKNLAAGEGGVFVTNDPEAYARAYRIRSFGLDLDVTKRRFDKNRPLDSGRELRSQGPGHMYRGNEMMAAVARAQLAALPERTAQAQRSALRLAEALRALPGIYPPAVPDGRTHVFHKFRVRFDLGEAGLAGVDARAFRGALLEALNAEGANACVWQDAPLSAHPIFSGFGGLGGGWPYTAAHDPEAVRANYEADYPVTRGLLDRSVVLFTQSRPLIGQPPETVARYADAFTKVWTERARIAERAGA
jgi:perosamine synthetase